MSQQESSREAIRLQAEAGRQDEGGATDGDDGMDRRGFLKCMAWAGTGLVWTMTAGGVLSADTLTASAGRRADSFSFVQLSDSHIGFKVEGVNADVTGTMQQAIHRINALPHRPDLVLHTGDLTQLSKSEQFDTVHQLIGGINTGGVFTVPGEHDVIGDQGAAYKERFSRRPGDKFYYSFDHRGVHFIGLSNIGGEDVFGVLGESQLEWLRRDLEAVRRDTPIVVFAHVPLYAVYPAWGWYTKDSARAMALLGRYSSVTVLNGHIHQVLHKVEGRIQFHVAPSTAFPQHHPGDGGPGPYILPADDLLRSLGYRSVTVVPGRKSPAIVESNLA